jgi:hypothetical protein
MHAHTILAMKGKEDDMKNGRLIIQMSIQWNF